MGARLLLQPEKKVLLFLPGHKQHQNSKVKKRYSRLSGRCAIIITTGKKVLVICLEGAQSLIRPEKQKIQLSVWQVRDCYYDRKKKSSSRVSGGCAIVITTGKKSSTVLVGA